MMRGTLFIIALAAPSAALPHYGGWERYVLRAEADAADVAGMAVALRAYQAIRQQLTDFTLPLFEQLLAAEAAGELAAAVSNIVAGSTSK